MRCEKCGKEIKNVYTFQDKNYGYNCYREIKTMYYAKLQHNRELLEVEKIEALLSIKNDSFTKSCREFKLKNNYLSKNQINILYSKLSKSETVILKILESDIDNKNIMSDLLCAKNDIIKSLFSNEILIEYIKRDRINKRKNIKKTYCIIKYKDIDDDFESYRIVDNTKLTELQNDEYINIITIK